MIISPYILNGVVVVLIIVVIALALSLIKVKLQKQGEEQTVLLARSRTNSKASQLSSPAPSHARLSRKSIFRKRDGAEIIEEEAAARTAASSSEAQAAVAVDMLEYVGKLHFRLSYVPATEALCVHLIEAIELPARDANGFSDPYVKVQLLPAGKSKISKVIRRTKDPYFNETMYFEG